MKILADSSLGPLQGYFSPQFQLDTYQTLEELKFKIKTAEALICRSTLPINETLLKNSTIKIVATASSGSDHIDKDYLARNNIEWIDAKGSNAGAVADYILATLAFLEINGYVRNKQAGIIGVGEVGSRVYKRLKSLKYSPLLYDPFKALEDTNHTYCEFNDLYDCDLLFIHANLHDSEPYSSRLLVSNGFLKNLKKHILIINAARGGIVNEEALLNYPQIYYCTDVYENEPFINPAIIDKAILCTPHIAGHSKEAKLLALYQISCKLHQRLDDFPPAMGSLCPFNLSLPSKALELALKDEWQKVILEIYDPLHETEILKNNPHPQFFQEIRKNHHRHLFDCYDWPRESWMQKAFFT